MFSFRKTFEKTSKNSRRTWKKQAEASVVLKAEKDKEQIKSVEGLFPKVVRTNEIKNETDEIKKWKEKNRWKDLVYKTNKYKYNFHQ